jgi:inorganic pyrophosphatase
MALANVPSGKQIPDDFNVIIEIPMQGDPVKYEVDKESGAIFVDRFMGTAMQYPCNYGYIPHTLSEDGDPVDVLVQTPVPLIPGVVVRCRPLGLLLTPWCAHASGAESPQPHTRKSSPLMR